MVTNRRKKVFRISILLVLLVFVAAGVSHGQDVQAAARVDSNHILIGDWLRLHVEVRHPQSLAVVIPTIKDSIGEFEVVKQDQPTTKREGSIAVTSAIFTVTAFDSGMRIIGSIPIAYASLQDTSRKVVNTQPIPITVGGLAVDTSQAIKDIKPPLKVPITFAEILPYLLAALVLAAAVWFFFYIRKKRRLGESILPVAPPRPAHEVALESLRALEAERLWQRSMVKEYYSKLTDILRLYIERQMTVAALEMTTDEILDARQIADLPENLRNPLRNLLERADLVKFARFQPDSLEHERSFQFALDFVEQTKGYQQQVGVTTENEVSPTEVVEVK